MSTSEDKTTYDLSTSESWSLVRDAVMGRLAVTTDDQPDIFPVNHMVDHGSVVFRTGTGTKMSAAVGHLVAFEVDGYDLATGTAWSVVLKGRAQRIDRLYDVLDVMELPISPWHDAPKPYFVRIEPGIITGRRIVVAGGVRAAPDAAVPERADDAK